jgi:hypothetical protein
MSNLKNLEFKTSTLTGAGKPKQAGEYLAGILVQSARLASAISTTQKSEEREKQKLSAEEEKQWNVLRISDQNEFTKKWNEEEANGGLNTSEQQEAFINANNKNTGDYFPENSIHSARYDSFLNTYGRRVTNTRIKENEILGEKLITEETSNLNLSDFGELENIRGLSESASFLNKNIKFSDTLGKVFEHTTLNMQRDYESGKLYGKTKSELKSIYGGSVIDEVKDKNSKGYILFQNSINEISKELKTQYDIDSTKISINNETDATAVMVNADINGIDQKKTLGYVSDVVTKNLAYGNVFQAVRISNQYKSFGSDINVLDNKVDNMFKTGVPDKSAFDLYNKTKNDYTYDSSVVSNINLLTAVASSNNYDLENPDEFKASLDTLRNLPKVNISNKDRKNISEKLKPSFYGLFGSYDNSKVAFLESRVKDYIRANKTVDEAFDLAEEEYDSYTSKTGRDKPYDMFASSDKDVNVIKRSFSRKDSEDDVTMDFIGNDKWKIYTEGHGAVTLSNRELKNRLNTRNKIEKTKSDFNTALKKENLTGTESEIRKAIRKKAGIEIDLIHENISKDEKNKLIDIMIHDGLKAIEESEKQADELWFSQDILF